MKSPEKFEKDAICKYLDSIDCWYFKPYMAGFGKSGVPDIIGCTHGYFFGIEVKAPGRQVTPIQRRRIEEIEHNGSVVWWGTADKVINEMKVWRAAHGYIDAN